MISHSYNTRHAARLRASTPERKTGRPMPSTPTKAARSESVSRPEPVARHASVQPEPVSRREPVVRAIELPDNPPTIDRRSIRHEFADAYHRDIMRAMRKADAGTRVELIREIVRYPQHLPLLSEYLFVIHDRDGQKQTEKGVLRALEAWKEFYVRGVNKVVQDEYHGIFFGQIRTVCALAL